MARGRGLEKLTVEAADSARLQVIAGHALQLPLLDLLHPDAGEDGLGERDGGSSSSSIRDSRGQAPGARRTSAPSWQRVSCRQHGCLPLPCRCPVMVLFCVQVSPPSVCLLQDLMDFGNQHVAAAANGLDDARALAVCPNFWRRRLICTSIPRAPWAGSRDRGGVEMVSPVQRTTPGCCGNMPSKRASLPEDPAGCHLPWVSWWLRVCQGPLGEAADGSVPSLSPAGGWWRGAAVPCANLQLARLNGSDVVVGAKFQTKSPQSSLVGAAVSMMMMGTWESRRICWQR